jgi:hypothetical protein
MVMKLYPWQNEMLNRIMNTSGGIEPGQMLITMYGRQAGKSQLNHYLQQYMQWLPDDSPKYKVSSQAMVDDKPWYTVHCSKDVADWVRQQPGKDKEWYQHISDKWTIFYDAFDIPEELYLMLVLKFGK